MPVAKNKTCHEVHCSEEAWLAFTQFQKQNNIADYGQAIQALLDFFLEFKDQLAEYQQKVEEVKQLKAEIKRRLSETNKQEQSIQAWMQVSADEQKVSYRVVNATKSLMEAKLGIEDILRLHKIVQATRIPIENLFDELQKIGSLNELIDQLNQEVNTLIDQRTALDEELAEAQTKAVNELRVLAKRLDEEQRALNKKLADERIKAADEIAAAKSKVLALEKKAKEYQDLLTSTDQQIAKVREFADQVEQTYRMLGLVLHTVIKQQFAETKASRIEHFPLRSLLFLAGAILTVAEETYGDRVFEMRVSRENMVPIRIRLSEIPALFAPAEAYRAQKELLFQQMELFGIYGDGDGTGNGEVMGDA